MQTVSIVGNLQLQWPPSVASLTSFLGLNALRLDSLSFVRPECLLQVHTAMIAPMLVVTSDSGASSCGQRY